MCEPWWTDQDQDDTWIQQQQLEEEQMYMEEQQEFEFEDTRSQQEIEQEYDVFMANLAKEEIVYNILMKREKDPTAKDEYINALIIEDLRGDAVELCVDLLRYGCRGYETMTFKELCEIRAKRSLSDTTRVSYRYW